MRVGRAVTAPSAGRRPGRRLGRYPAIAQGSGVDLRLRMGRAARRHRPAQTPGLAGMGGHRPAPAGPHPPADPRRAGRAGTAPPGRLEAVLARRRRPLPPLQPPDERRHHRHGTHRHGPPGPHPTLPQPASYGASSEEYDDYRDGTDRGEPVQPSPALVAYLDARDEHLAADYDAQVIPRHKLWTNDGWLVTPDELDAALPHAPTTALDRRQRPIPWWRQWLDYLDGARGHGGIRVH